MTVRIYFTVGGHEDSFVLVGESAEEIRQMAEAELDRRGGTDPWSVVLEERDL